MGIFLALALTLTAFTFWFKRQGIGFGAVAGWILVLAYAFTLSVATWDIYYSLGWFSAGLAIVMGLETMMLREKKVVGGDELDELDELIEERERLAEAQNKMKLATGSTRRLRRVRRARKRASANGDEDRELTLKERLQIKYGRR